MMGSLQATPEAAQRIAAEVNDQRPSRITQYEFHRPDGVANRLVERIPAPRRSAVTSSYRDRVAALALALFGLAFICLVMFVYLPMLGGQDGRIVTRYPGRGYPRN
jgi:hypothetical protein